MDHETLVKIATLLALRTDFELFLERHQGQHSWIAQAQKLKRKMDDLLLIINETDALLTELKHYFPMANVNFGQPSDVLELLDEVVLWLKARPKFCSQLSTWFLSSIFNFNQPEEQKLADLEKWFRHLKIFYNMSSLN